MSALRPFTEQEMKERFPDCVLVMFIFDRGEGADVDIIHKTEWMESASENKRNGLATVSLEGLVEYLHHIGIISKTDYEGIFHGRPLDA